VPVQTTTVDAELPTQRAATSGGTVEFAERAADGDASVNLICVNADELPRFARTVGPESSRAPQTSESGLGDRRDPCPLGGGLRAARRDLGLQPLHRRQPQPGGTDPGRPRPATGVAAAPRHEPELGLPAGFRFMFMFDFFSTIQRKNPVAVIEAFKRAFAPGEARTW